MSLRLLVQHFIRNYMPKREYNQRFYPSPIRMRLVEKYLIQGWSLAVSVAKAGICSKAWHEWAHDKHEDVLKLRELHKALKKSGQLGIKLTRPKNS